MIVPQVMSIELTDVKTGRALLPALDGQLCHLVLSVVFSLEHRISMM